MGWTTPTDRSTGYTVTSADYNVIEDDLAFLYGDTAWTAASGFTNSWVSAGGAYSAVGYRKVGTMVKLRGALSNGASGTAAFTLPAGYRPPATVIIPINGSANTYANITITSVGVLSPAGANVAAGAWLDGVLFDTLA